MQHNLVKAYALLKTFQKTTLKQKKLFLPVVAVVLLLNGCSLYEWKYKYSSQEVIGGGIISDSTALLLMTTYEFWDYEGAGNEQRNVKEFLALVDTRFEKTYWKKPVENRFGTGFTLIDSIMIFTADRTSTHTGKISTITINEQFDKSEKIVVPKGKDLELNAEAWDYYSSGNTIRPWHSGLILARGMGQYALIDTTVGTYKLWNPTEEFAWVNSCADVKWNSVGGLCLKQIPDTTGFVLLKNGVDTLAVRYHESNGSLLYFEGNSIYSRGWTFLIYENYEVSKNPFRNLVNYDKKF